MDGGSTLMKAHYLDTSKFRQISDILSWTEGVVPGKLIFCIICSCTGTWILRLVIDLHCLPIVTVLLNVFSLQSGIFCILVDALIQLEIYSNFVQVCICCMLFGHSYCYYMCHKCLYANNSKLVKLQAHLAPSGYLKIPTVSSLFYIAACISWQPRYMFFLFHFCLSIIFSVNHLLVLSYSIVVL
jgi:hypothetical protein